MHLLFQLAPPSCRESWHPQWSLPLAEDGSPLAYIILGDHRVAWQEANVGIESSFGAIWRNTKHLAPLPCKERSGYLYEPSLAPCDLQLWDPEKDAQKKVRFLTSLQTLSCFEKRSKKWPIKSWLASESFLCFNLSMTYQRWVIHWHQIPRLRGSAGASAQRTSNRAINLKPPGLPPSSSARGKKQLRWIWKTSLKVSHNSQKRKQNKKVRHWASQTKVSNQQAACFRHFRTSVSPQTAFGTSSWGPTQPTVPPAAAMESPQPRWRSMDRMTSFTLSKLSRIKALSNTKNVGENSCQTAVYTPTN